ncbi:MAG TPA: hypothetical protein VFO40_19240, partial [Chthoniobacterales bacterium]|nr:hypothetical protein [Chthoniobacterales bacterium]
MPAIHLSKDPSIFAVLFEDSAALLGLLIAFIGLLLTQILEKSVFDGIASLLIGIVLIVASTLLAAETRDLLIGEGARSSTLDRICELVRADAAVEAARRPLTMYLGPETVLLALDVQFKPTLSAREVTLAVDRLELAIREKYPRIRHIYLEAESINARVMTDTERENVRTGPGSARNNSHLSRGVKQIGPWSCPSSDEAATRFGESTPKAQRQHESNVRE